MHDGIPEADYHADPCPEPSLNSSIARILLDQSPQHAATFHPRLGGQRRDDKEEFDFGKAYHALVLEKRTDSVVVIEADNFRTKAAQQERDAAYGESKVPLLAKKWKAVQDTARTIRESLDARPDADDYKMAGAAVEQTLVWREGDVWLRARLDVVREDIDLIWDLKSAKSAEPEAFARSVFKYGYDVQDAFYRRGMRAITGREFEFRFVVAESGRPHAVGVFDLDPEARAIADRKVERAIRIWGECLRAGRWPGYPPHVATVSAPAWVLQQEIEREIMEAS